MQYKPDQKSPMRDQAELNFDLYSPDQDGAYPTVLVRTPYTKNSMFRERIYTNYKRFTDRGYHVMIQECRGTGLSGGDFNANAHSEYEDGYDTVEWIARQPWSDGRVGMMGLSYFGFTQLSTASLSPAPLKAICPFMTMSQEMFGTWLPHAYNYGHIHWIYGQLLSQVEHYIPDAAVRERALPILQEHNRRLDEYALLLPANRNPAAFVDDVPLLSNYLDVINGIEDCAFWKSMSHPTSFAGIRIPMLHCTGWFDVCLDTTIHNWNTMLAQSDARTCEESKLIIGPWCHGGEFGSALGRFDFGAANDGAGQDINGKMLAWFDRHLKENPNEVDRWPKVRYYVLGLDQWLNDTAWPPSKSVQIPYYLHAQNRLSLLAPEKEEPDCYVYNPMDPAPAYAGEGEIIPDYALLGERSDTIVYETEPVRQPIVIAGTVQMDLFAITDAKDTDFTCRILDVYPDGFEMILAQGLVRAKWRNGADKPDFIQPDLPVRYTFEVGNVGCCLLPEHKLKIHVSSALFSLYDRNLNTGEPSGSCDHCVVAYQTILHDSSYPSCVLVPVLSVQ